MTVTVTGRVAVGLQWGRQMWCWRPWGVHEAGIHETVVGVSRSMVRKLVHEIVVYFPWLARLWSTRLRFMTCFAIIGAVSSVSAITVIS